MSKESTRRKSIGQGEKSVRIAHVCVGSGIQKVEVRGEPAGTQADMTSSFIGPTKEYGPHPASNRELLKEVPFSCFVRDRLWREKLKARAF